MLACVLSGWGTSCERWSHGACMCDDARRGLLERMQAPAMRFVSCRHSPPTHTQRTRNARAPHAQHTRNTRTTHAHHTRALHAHHTHNTRAPHAQDARNTRATHAHHTRNTRNTRAPHAQRTHARAGAPRQRDAADIRGGRPRAVCEPAPGRQLPPGLRCGRLRLLAPPPVRARACLWLSWLAGAVPVGCAVRACTRRTETTHWTQVRALVTALPARLAVRESTKSAGTCG